MCSLWGGSVLNLGTKKHKDKYFDGIDNLDYPGCFAMTELHHGNSIFFFFYVGEVVHYCNCVLCFFIPLVWLVSLTRDDGVNLWRTFWNVVKKCRNVGINLGYRGLTDMREGFFFFFFCVY